MNKQEAKELSIKNAESEIKMVENLITSACEKSEMFVITGELSAATKEHLSDNGFMVITSITNWGQITHIRWSEKIATV